MMKWILPMLLIVIHTASRAQTPLHWVLADTAFGPLPSGMHVFRTSDSLNGRPFKAVYAVVPLRNRALTIQIDTALNRRLPPDSFYKRLHHPPYGTNHLVVNLGYFSFEKNKSLSLLIKNGEMLAAGNVVNARKAPKTGYQIPARAALALTQRGRADAAWVLTDSFQKRWMVMEKPIAPITSESILARIEESRNGKVQRFNGFTLPTISSWKAPRWVVGGGPMVVQGGTLKVTANEEQIFAGKGMTDLHPRTAMGYTADRQLIIMVVEGRNPQAAGASLTELGWLLLQAGCVEALNMDGGGSSCMLINGKPVINVSDKEGQRPVPAVLYVQHQ